MRMFFGCALMVGLLGFVSFSVAQPPGGRGKGGEKGGPGGGRSSSVDEMVNRLMAFDKDKEGFLTKKKMGDSRLAPLLDKADANKDGKVTKEELTDFFTKENAKLGNNQGGPGGFEKGPGGRGQKGPGGQGKQKGPGGPGGQKGPGGPPGGNPNGPGGGPPPLET